MKGNPILSIFGYSKFGDRKEKRSIPVNANEKREYLRIVQF